MTGPAQILGAPEQKKDDPSNPDLKKLDDLLFDILENNSGQNPSLKKPIENAGSGLYPSSYAPKVPP